MNTKVKILLIGVVLIAGISFSYSSLAFIGPSAGQNPGTGSGLLEVDANRNIGFGTASPTPSDTFDSTSTQSGSVSHGYVFTVASTTNPGVGIKNLTSGIQYLWSARNFGALQLYREGGGNPGKVIFDISPLGTVGVSYPSFNIDSGVRFQVGDGDVQAPGFRGSGVNLTSIDPQNFIAGSSLASGNFAVNGALAVGTTTVTGLPTNGLFVSGNVGIGTTAPTQKLDVNGSVVVSASGGRVLLPDGAFGATSLGFSSDTYLGLYAVGNSIYLSAGSGPNPYVYLAASESSAGRWKINASNALLSPTSDDFAHIGSTGARVQQLFLSYGINVGTGASPETVIRSTGASYFGGNVGIGTASPTAKLDVYRATTDTRQTDGIRVHRPGSFGQYGFLSYGNASQDTFLGSVYTGGGTSSYGRILFTQYNSALTERVAMIIDNAGNVGIATITPAYKLDVAGTGRFTQPVIVGTPTADSHAATRSYVDSTVVSGSGWTDGGANVYLTTSGDNVGIGTANPFGKLTVDSPFSDTAGSRKGIELTSGSGGLEWWSLGLSSAGDFVIDDVKGTASNALTILTSNNRVGIGTASPSQLLEVLKSQDANTFVSVSNINTGVNAQAGLSLTSSGGTAQIRLTSSGYTGVVDWQDSMVLNADSSVDGGIVLHSSDKVRIQNSAGTDALTVKGGNVGIGTTTPSFPLSVQSNSGANGIQIIGRNNGTTDEGTLAFVDNDGLTQAYLQTKGNNLAIMPNGNVGIATTTPAYKLDVAGTGRFTQPVIVGTPTIATHAATRSYVDSTVVSGSGWTDGGANVYLTTTSDNVGIGTTAPGALLHVNQTSAGDTMILEKSTTEPSLRFVGDANNDFVLTVVGTNFRVANDGGGTSLLEIQQNGNVGIGTTGPGYKLDINGANTATNLRVVGGGLFQSNDFGTVFQSLQATNKRSTLFFQDETGTQTGRLGVDISGTDDDDLQFIAGSGSTPQLHIEADGNVGIATTTPAYKLDVAGTGRFTQPVIVGTPTIATHAATRSYVDSASVGNTNACSGDATCEVNAIDANNGNITGVNKLTVTTIDPLYQIGRSKYATYAASIVGGVKEEYVGRAKLSRSGNGYEYTIDFGRLKEGSDLWVWHKTVEFSKDSVEAIATPYGQAANIYYVISGEKLTFVGDSPAEFSYRLTGKRFDWRRWPTYAVDQNERPSFIIK